jgi:hypothetical protein
MAALPAARARRDFMASNPLQESPEEGEDCDVLERSDRGSTGAPCPLFCNPQNRERETDSCLPSPTGFKGVCHLNDKFAAFTPRGYMEVGMKTHIGTFATGTFSTSVVCPLTTLPHPTL